MFENQHDYDLADAEPTLAKAARVAVLLLFLVVIVVGVWRYMR